MESRTCRTIASICRDVSTRQERAMTVHIERQWRVLPKLMRNTSQPRLAAIDCICTATISKPVKEDDKNHELRTRIRK